VSLLRKTHLKQTQKSLLQPRNNLDEDDDFIIDDEVTFGRNRRSAEFGNIVHEDVDLSDHVKFRLWLARMIALQKYDAIYSTT
jgi:hypothetical protein